MKLKTLSVSLLITGTTVLAGCGTTTGVKGDTVSRSQYNADIAAKNKQIESLQQSLTTASSKPAPAAPVAGADPTNELFPPNAKPGHCYARMLIPAKYKTTQETVLVSEASETIKVIPAQFQTVTEKVLVKEASSRIETVPATYKKVTENIIDVPETVKLVPVPATYKNVTERVLVKPATVKKIPVAAEYKTVTERVLDKPAHTVWKKGAGFAGNAIKTDVDRSTGEIMCLVEVPATYKTVEKRVLVSQATTKTVEIPAEYKTITRTVVDSPATTRKVVIPAKYKTVTRNVIDKPAFESTVSIPAEYKTVSVVKEVSPVKEVRNEIPAVYDQVAKRTKISDEELVWSEVLCDVNVTRDVVTQLQNRLKNAGYYRNAIDGIWGPDTQRGIIGYSKAKGLPSGSNYIPLETAKALGVSL